MTPNTLADPTDRGNKPGSGPLRAGGQDASGTDITPRSEENLPSTPSMAVERQQHALEIVRDLWEGTERLRKKAAQYLTRGRGEDSQDWRVRVARAVFANFFQRTIEGLTGLVFRKDPVLGDDVPSIIRTHWEDIDLAGTHGDVFVRDSMQDALIAGHAAVLIEYPQTDGSQTAADEIGRIRPYWVPIRKDDIVSWRTDTDSGKQVLTQLVLREEAMEARGEYGEHKRTRYRVFYRNEGVVGFRLLEVTKERTVVEVDAGTYPTQDEIPVVEVPTSGRRSLFDSEPPLIDLAHLNLAHFQQWSDLATSIYKTNVPIFFTAGVLTPPEPGTAAAALVLGPNSSLHSRNPDGKAEYVSHNGAGHESSLAMLQDLKSDMGSLGLAMLAPQKRTAETAEAKRLDKSESDSALSVTARALQDAVERMLGFHARYLRLPEGGSIEINRDFQGLVLSSADMMAWANLVKAGAPPVLALYDLQAGGRIRDDQDIEALELEWMAGEASSRDAEQFSAEVQT